MTISLELTIPDEDHALIKQAASLSGISVGKFILETARSRAYICVEMNLPRKRRKPLEAQVSAQLARQLADKAGNFKDIQTYRKAHRSDVKRKAKGERA